MISADKIDNNKLKEAAKALNDSGLLEEKLKVIGVGKEALAANFCEAIDGLDDDAAGKIETECPIAVEMYNTLLADELPPADEKPAKEKDEKPAKEKAEKPAKEKAEKPAKEKKEVAKEKAEKPAKEKKEVAKGPFGSVIGSAANNIDTLLEAGTTFEAVMAKAGVSRARVSAHIKFLEVNRNVKVTRDEENLKAVRNK